MPRSESAELFLMRAIRNIRLCGFVSFQQCMATVTGIGGFCVRNTLYQAPADRIDDVIIRIEKTARSITIWVRAFATPAEAFGKLGMTDFALWRALRESNPYFQ